MSNKLRSVFTIVKIDKDKNYILLRDDFTESNPTTTVTNDAENVVEYLYEHGLINGETTIYYIDLWQDCKYLL